MAQLNVYVSEELEQKIKEVAKREGRSVSAFVLEAVKSKIEPDKWSDEFLTLMEASPTEFPEVADLPMQKRKALDDL